LFEQKRVSAISHDRTLIVKKSFLCKETLAFFEKFGILYSDMFLFWQIIDRKCRL